MSKLAEIPEELRAWVDETGIDDNETYAYGRSPKGERCLAVCPGKKSTRISIIAGLIGKNLLAPCWFEGMCNTDFFNEWLEKILLPELPKNATVILDNAAFHKSEKTRQIIENAGCKILFLPPYSPRDNKIEHEWFPIKKQIRKILQTFQNIHAAVEATLIIRS